MSLCKIGDEYCFRISTVRPTYLLIIDRMKPLFGIKELGLFEHSGKLYYKAYIKTNGNVREDLPLLSVLTPQVEKKINEDLKRMVAFYKFIMIKGGATIFVRKSRKKFILLSRKESLPKFQPICKQLHKWLDTRWYDYIIPSDLPIGESIFFLRKELTKIIEEIDPGYNYLVKIWLDNLLTHYKK